MKRAESIPVPTLTNKDVFRFISKINFSSTCWEWNGCKRKGYGYFSIKKIGYTSHRISYEFFRNEKIPLDKFLDHLCRNRKCCNPFHLEIVTNQENIARGWRATKPHCKNGHLFVGAMEKRSNRVKPGRLCRKCKAVNQKKYIDRVRGIFKKQIL